MLKHLSITNYAIIDDLNLDFESGFTVLTGETGAGKSIILGALSLILGKRADTTVLFDQSKKCIVEGEFQLQGNHFLSFFKQNDLDYDQNTYLRREINASGKSRAFINDTPVSLSILKELAKRLVNVHTQHETLDIVSNETQITVIDAYAGIEGEVESLKKQYASYLSSLHQLNQIKNNAAKASSDTDYMLFQIEEIETLNLQPNEKEKIEKELQLINNAEEIKRVLSYTSDAIQNDDTSVVALLKMVVDKYASIKNVNEHFAETYNRLNSILIDVEDIGSEVNRENDNFSFDPENLSYLNDRLGKIYTIEQKHGLSSTEEILSLLQKLKQQLEDVSSYDDKIEELELQVAQEKESLVDKATQISKQRQKVFHPIESEIKLLLADLGMVDADFKIEHLLNKELGIQGLDSISFLFSANKGYKVNEIGKVASGGELSRLMLIIKSILSKSSNVLTVIFDEIDTGVSGDIADKMADIMAKMGDETQVISITHLPQVAGKGQYHYKIAKDSKSDRTKTIVQQLNDEERVEELAKMLSGKILSDAALKNAQVLLNK